MLDDVPYCYLTTTGRSSGQAHRIEIWFATEDGRTLFLLAGGGRSSDWVANLEADPEVEVELAGERHELARGRVLEAGSEEDARARRMLVAKYRSDDDDLEAWGRGSLGVAIDLEPIGA